MNLETLALKDIKLIKFDISNLDYIKGTVDDFNFEKAEIENFKMEKQGVRVTVVDKGNKATFIVKKTRNEGTNILSDLSLSSNSLKGFTLKEFPNLKLGYIRKLRIAKK